MRIKRFFESVSNTPTAVIEEVDNNGVLLDHEAKKVKICISEESETNYVRNRMFEFGDKKVFDDDRSTRDRWLQDFGKFRDFELFDENINDGDECWITIEYLDDFPENVRAYKSESEAKDYLRQKINMEYNKIFLRFSDALNTWNEENSDKKYLMRTEYSMREVELKPEIKKVLTQRRFDL